MEYIYLLREREFAEQNKNVYKIGRSVNTAFCRPSKTPYDRMNGYPKGSQIIMIYPVNNNVITIETNLKQLMTAKFTRCDEYGTEYFKGNLRDIINIMTEFLYQHKICNYSIQNDELQYDINCGVPKLKICEFKDHCEICSNDENCCYDSCDRCKIFRKLRKNETNLIWTKYFNEHISEVTIKPKENIKILNNNINYIQTKDSFFHVIITSSQDNADVKLRYIFTYLMCGISGRKLFPLEDKHSKAMTFQVSAAKYHIVTEDNIHTLYGVLRYKYHKINSMTIKKLENMGDTNYIVKAYEPNFYNYNKKQLIKDDIDRFVMTVMNSDNGSGVEDFYINDN